MIDFYVNYSVDGLRFQAGPYELHQVIAHYLDIKGYCRVKNVSMVLERDPERRLIESQAAMERED